MQNDYPQTLEELTTRIESMFELGEPGTSALAVTGEPFVKLAIGGELYESEPWKLMATEEVNAVECFYRDFLAYAFSVTSGATEGFKLYWRKKPVLISLECQELAWRSIDRPKSADAHTELGEKFFYQIRARLLISNKPAIEGGNIPKPIKGDGYTITFEGESPK